MSGYKLWKTNLFYIFTALFWSSLYTYQPTMSPYLTSIGVSYSFIGVIGGSYGLVQMLLRIPVGLMSDRLGKRKAFITLGISTSVLSSFILYVADSPILILFGRGLAGAAASSWVVFTVLFSSYFDKTQAASRISFLAAWNNSGQLAGMLIGGFTAGYMGYKFPFLMGLVIGAIGLLMSFFIEEKVPPCKEPPKIARLLSAAKNKNLMTMSVLAVLSQLILFGTMNTFTPLIASDLKATSTELGYLSFFGNLPRVLSAMLCGLLLARKAGAKRLLALSFIMFAVSSAAIPFSPDLWTLYALSIVSGFGSGMSMTVLLSLCTREIEDIRRSAAMGFFQAIYGMGMFIGPVAVGFFSDGFGIIWGFIFAALIAVIGLAGSLLFVENESLVKAV